MTDHTSEFNRLLDAIHPDRGANAWLADELEVTRPTVSNWRTGKSQPPLAVIKFLRAVQGSMEPIQNASTRAAAMELIRASDALHSVAKRILGQ